MRKTLLPLCLLLSLSACASGEKEVFSCPATGFMRDADTAVFFAKASKTPAPDDVSTSARLANLSGSCKLRRESEAVVDFSFDILVDKKPAGTGVTQQNLSYFVAVLDSDEAILQRENFYVTVHFTETGSGSTTGEHRIRIPLSSVGMAASHKIAIGFTLTPEQLEYNKAYP